MSSSAGSAGAESRTIPVICGPTASGKSAIAMWLSQRREIVVISADSRQIYRRFDVGTAKPTREDRDRVPHRGIDVVEPTVRYSAAEWSSLAERAILEALSAQRLPVVVGGTGFYISALFRPLWEEPALGSERRDSLQQHLASYSTPELRRWCERLDPDRAHLGRAQLLRAIEVALLTGKRLSVMHVSRARPGAWKADYLLVDPGRAELQARIAARAQSMFDAGWAEEVQTLMGEVPADAPAWNATGYEVVRELVEGKLDRAVAVERVVVDTRQYAKRQRTWFRNQLREERVQRLDPTASGWQEVVERWVTQFGESMNASVRAL